MSDIRKLGQRMVPPDNHVLYVGHVNLRTTSNQTTGTVLVQSCESRKVFLGEIGGREQGDQSVGVGWVAHHQHLGVLGRKVVKGFALLFEDSTVCLQEVSTLHTFTTRHRTHQNGIVNLGEGLLDVAGRNNTTKEREGAVLKLHDNTTESLLCGRNVKQVQNEWLGFAKHQASRNHRDQRIGDLTSGTSDKHSNRFSRERHFGKRV
mmetsp:Transcript_11931/g.30157  ORF Transcript_11931/g.30157 Transcript_11931/m.30157 type:complete len:206 (+) Transcript_11931:1139-1756(+)